MASIHQSQPKPGEIRLLKLRDAVDPASVGGKAASLGFLLRNGLPCPDGVVVPVAAYHLHAQSAFRQLSRDASDADRARAILDTPLAPELVQELKTQFSSPDGWPLAVRSSATFEDGASASCAGQFDTFLNVSSQADLLDSIRKTWASFWSPRARQYFANRKHEGNAEGMAVVVQSMVTPIFSGVVFSVDPVAADPNVLYVEWVNGLGELLVSGERISGRAWLGRTGGILRIDHLSNDPAPSLEIWECVLKATKKLETIHHAQQDIEWAWSATGFVLLQSRPVTKIYPSKQKEPAPWLLMGRPPGGWTDLHRSLFELWDEYNPPTVRPLEMDLFMGAIWQASMDMLDQGSGVPQIEQVTILHGEVPIQIDPTASQRRQQSWPRGEVRPDLEATMLWGADQVRLLKARLIAIAKDDRAGLITLLQEVAAIHRTITVTRLRCMQSWIDGEFSAHAILEPMLQAQGLNVEDALEKLVMGIEHETSAMNREMGKLADALRKGRDSAWDQSFQDFLDRFGHFQNDGIPIGETPNSVFRQIEQMAASKTVRASLASNGGEAESKRIRDCLPQADKAAFDKAVAGLRRWLVVRENSKTQVEVARPLLRRITHGIALELVSEGAIKRAEEVWLLTIDELQKAFVEKQVPPADILATRNASIAWKATRSWLPDGFSAEYCRPDASSWKGLPGSPGSASGLARIVTGPEEFAKVGPTDIVVARSTNPVWTQLFSRIAGIVVENGSRLSHAAIVAREYGIPAVVGLPGILSVLKDGERISINGNSGEVMRIIQTGENN